MNGADRAELEILHFYKQVTDTVLKQVDDMQAARQVVGSLDGLGSVPATRRGDLIVQLTKRSNAVSIINRLDASKRTELLSHLGASPQGVRLVDDLGEQGTKSLLELSYESASAKQLRANLFERYDALNAGSEARSTFARITSESDLRKSWVRASGAADTSLDGIRTALIRFRKVDNSGHSVEQFRTADAVNAGYDPGYKDPYAAGTIAVEFVTSSQDEFVRVHRSDNQAKSWMMREQEITGMTPEEIQQKFSLPEDPVYVSDVTVPEGTSVRTGTVEKNFGGQRGATQFELRERISSENFHNQRELPVE